MSKIEVNEIDKQNGSTLTIGGSGTTVQLGTGASQTGFGRTGTVDWQTGSIKTANFTAVSGEGYFCNTTGGAFEVDLPAGSAGAIVAFKDYLGTWDNNALTVDPNGSEKIGGGPAGETASLSTENGSVTLVYVDSTRGWLVVNDATQGVAGETAQFVTASGGTETTSGDFKIHTFTGPGSFVITCAGNTKGSNSIDYLVIAGGGAGGASSCGSVWGGAGGGAGGYRESSGAASGCYSRSPLGACVSALCASVTNIPVTVGAGGAGGPANTPSSPVTNNGTSGSNSSFSTIISAGGGYGGARSITAAPAPDQITASKGADGGSGGGSGFSNNYGHLGGSGNTSPVSPPQGNGGGKSGPADAGSPTCVPGGGGGATGAGQTGPAPGNCVSSPSAGVGGAAATSSINGTPTARAGGGGGGGTNPGQAGAPATGGGGAGGNQGGGAGVTGTAGTANTGGGGGGSSGRTSPNPGAAGSTGGSGIVIIRYKFQ